MRPGWRYFWRHFARFRRDRRGVRRLSPCRVRALACTFFMAAETMRPQNGDHLFVYTELLDSYAPRNRSPSRTV